MSAPSEKELRKPFLYRYMKQIPEEGKFTFPGFRMDGGNLRRGTEKGTFGAEYEKRIESIRRFERQLTDNGYLVLKFFMHIEKEEQDSRI